MNAGAGKATAYDVIRGDLARLQMFGGDFSGATTTCLQDDVPGPTLIDTDRPDPGQGYWYLVPAVNCVGSGSYDSGAMSQTASRDAGIAASGADCP